MSRIDASDSEFSAMGCLFSAAWTLLSLPFWIGAFFIHFVDRDNNRGISGFGMLNSFNRLWHNTIIGCNNNNNDIRCFSTT